MSSSEGGFADSEGSFAPLPTLVACLTVRFSLPPPRTGLRGQSPRSDNVEPSSFSGHG
jgi:hypothetical protein